LVKVTAVLCLCCLSLLDDKLAYTNLTGSEF